jgi:UDP-2,4-diacetamido-2,4,6-trideoxy-beta-L-altropyranose hydrolase
VLIDQNPFPDADKRYSNRVGPETLMMLGPEYALLRSEFSAMRRNLNRHFEEVSRLLVGFGGADPANATERVVSALLEGLGETMEMVVVAGPANPHFARLRDLWGGERNIQLHRNLKCMAKVMAESDLAVGGGGVNALERCALGLPSLTYAIADNQVIPSETLSDIGAAQFMGRIENFDSEELIRAMCQLGANAHARASLSRKGMDLVDGLGAYRAVNTLLEYE